MLEWLAAAAVLIVSLWLLPWMLGRARRAQRASGGSGVWVGVGLALSMVFDPKSAPAIELVDRKEDERQEEESGDRPGG
jgi:hypothetical protein